jgi:hypothetical protein
VSSIGVAARLALVQGGAMAIRILREIAAFLVAPIPAGLVAVLVSRVSGYPDPVAGGVFVYLVLTVFGLFPGVPIRLILQFRRMRSWVAFAMGGSAMILIPVLPFMIWNAAAHVYPVWYAASSAAIWGICGLMTGLVYRALAISGPASGGVALSA